MWEKVKKEKSKKNQKISLIIPDIINSSKCAGSEACPVTRVAALRDLI